MAVAVFVTGAACGGGDGGPSGSQADKGRLVGLFRMDSGECSGKTPEGSYFQMIQPGGEIAKGPYVENGDSPCRDKTFTPLRPGADGGLLAGEYQPYPDPAFAPDGDSLASSVVTPEKWFGVEFSTATNQTDPQTDVDVGAPEVVLVGKNRLGGDISSFSAAWNKQHFNQGAPKPDGSRPGNTMLLSGTYDAATDAFVLEWASQIVGGPFDKFTGFWHLEGTFEPK